MSVNNVLFSNCVIKEQKWLNLRTYIIKNKMKGRRESPDQAVKEHLRQGREKRSAEQGQ